MIHRKFTYYLPISFDSTVLEISAAPRQGHRCFVFFLEAITLRIAEFNVQRMNFAFRLQITTSTCGARLGRSPVWSIFQSLTLVPHLNIKTRIRSLHV